MITANEPASSRYRSPYPSPYQTTPYQNSPRSSVYQQSSSSSTPSLNPNAPLERRRKAAPEGPQTGVKDKKGKKKEKAPNASSSTQSHGADPLEIAYGPTIGTHTEITEEDFEVDTETGPHKPQKNAEAGGRLSPGLLGPDDSPFREESDHWGKGDEEEGGGKGVQYTEHDDHNVWGR